jgi:methylated-DNA-[protein]-cysteine S-methyltransferase
VERLRRYFCGNEVVFPDELDLSRATDFQRDVWKATQRIPFGATRSYTWVSKQINKPWAVWAVGQALGKNPLPIIIPCHRVLNLHGSLGGYSGGLEMKRYLLALESEKSR